jgi:hypothetical protein
MDPMGSVGSCLRFALVLLAACGSVKGSDTDAPGPDADLGGDATVVTEAALFGGTVGAPVGDIDIISTLPNNTVLAMAKTGPSGSATIRVYPGGMVTAVYRHTIDMGADLITWVGVKPGDTLTFGSRLFSTSGQMSTSIGSTTYSWPAQPNATAYNIATSCVQTGVGAPTTSLVSTEYSTCHKEPMDVLFAAFNGSGITHFSFRSNVPFTNGGSVATGGWSPAQTATINITGLPPEVTSVSGFFSTILDGNTSITFAGGSNGTPTGGAFSGTFPWHGTGERTVGQVSLGRTGFSPMRILDSFGASTLTQTVATPTLTPWVQGSVVASSALGMASWFLVSEAASVHDGQLLRATWSHTISGTAHPHQWSFIVPPDQTSLTFPKLPAQFSENLPFPQDFLNASLRVYDIGSVTGYDMVRALPSSTIMCLDCAVRAGDLQRVVFTP